MRNHLLKFSLLCLTFTCWINALAANNFLTGGSPDFSAFSGKPAQVSSEEPVRVNMIAEERSVQPGRPFWVSINVDLDIGWHTYWKNPGEAGLATSVEWTLPQGFEVAELLWPTPNRFTEKGVITFGYSEPFALLAKIIPAKGAADLSHVNLIATVRWVTCNDGNCLPGDTSATLTLPVSTSYPVRDASQTALFDTARGKLPKVDLETVAEDSQNRIRVMMTPQQLRLDDFVAAYFVPAEAGKVSYRQFLNLERSNDGKSYIAEIIKTPEGKETGVSRIEGVLLLQPKTGTSTTPVAALIDAPVKASGQVADASDSLAQEGPQTSSAGEFEGGIGLALLMAFVGGMILNLMPCVLPVISLKVLSIIKMSGKSRSTTIKHGIAFAVGVLLSFWALAGVLLALQAYGHAVGWGFQLQEPIFIAVLVAVLLIFSLSLFGVFEMGTGFASWAGTTEMKANKQSSGLMSSVFNGVLATAVATPCTGPFLGSALGFAVTLPPAAALTIFTAIGLGMSFPYLLLTAFPQLVKWLPKPGDWMIAFKQFMGFLLVATIIWLLWVFGAHTDNFGITLLLSSLFIMSIACWVYGRWCTPIRSRRVRKIGLLTCIGLMLIGSYVLVVSANVAPEYANQARTRDLIDAKQNPRAWLPFNTAAIEQYRGEGKPVFIDFTAKWCLICQTNHLVLSLDDLESKFEDLGIVKIKADWTRPDPAITKELRKYGRNGVPLYLLYPPGATEPLILPQVLTPDVVTAYLNQMSSLSKKPGERPQKVALP